VTMALAQCAGTAISLKTVDRLGRAALLKLSAAGMTAVRAAARPPLSALPAPLEQRQTQAPAA